MMMMMAFRQIPTMTKSHHGGNMSFIGDDDEDHDDASLIMTMMNHTFENIQAIETWA